jgi:mono/diheme cytochrome c family protein
MSLSDRLAGLEEEHITNIIPVLQHFAGRMPPFPGNNNDAADLARYLASIAADDPLVAKTALSDSEKSEVVFNRRCGGCHTLTGFRPIGDSFEDVDSESAEEIIMILEDLADEMPPFTGSDEELRLLIEYLTGAAR